MSPVTGVDDGHGDVQVQYRFQDSAALGYVIGRGFVLGYKLSAANVRAVFCSAVHGYRFDRSWLPAVLAVLDAGRLTYRVERPAEELAELRAEA